MTPRKSKHDDPRSLINDHAPDRGASRSLTESRDALFFQGDSLTPRADISTTACRLRHLDPLLPSRSSPPTLCNARELPSFTSLDRDSRFAMPVLTRFPFVPISSVLSSSIALPLAPPSSSYTFQLLSFNFTDNSLACYQRSSTRQNTRYTKYTRQKVKLERRGLALFISYHRTNSSVSKKLFNTLRTRVSINLICKE